MRCPNPKCSGWVRPVDVVKQDDRKYFNVVYKCDTCEYTEYKPIKEGIINNKIGVPFEKLYCATQYEVYKDDIEKFFNDEILDRFQYWTRPDGIQVAKGFIWVATHEHFATLTIEPMDGRQCEIAVRFKHGEGKWKETFYNHKYSGYSISPEPFIFCGIDTGGH